MRTENPAKVFLRRYLGLCGRMDALQRAIDRAMDRAYSTNITLKEVQVVSSHTPDPMATAVTAAIDASEVLYKHKQEVADALREILTAIESVKDERQKAVLTMRYISGDSFQKIMEQTHYEKTQVYVIHGRGLVEINKWMERRGIHDKYI